MRIAPIMFILILITNQSYGCSCDRVSVFKELKFSDLVFKGKVIERSTFQHKDSLYQLYPETDSSLVVFDEYQEVEFTFLVRKLYKGKLKGDTVVITTSGGEADCGKNFLLNEKYLVYSYVTDQTWSYRYPTKTTPYLTAHVCSRNKLSRKTLPPEWLVMSLARLFRKDKLILPYENLGSFIDPD